MSIGTKTDDHGDLLLAWANSRDHRDLLLAWMGSQVISSWNTPYAITLRLKKGATREAAEANVVDFIKKLNKKVFKNTYSLYGKRLRCMSKIEGRDEVEENQNKYGPHVLMIIESPSHISEIEFRLLIQEQWEETKQVVSRFFYGQNKQKGKVAWNECKSSKWVIVDLFHIEKVRSTKWINYISKKRTALPGSDILIRSWTL